MSDLEETADWLQLVVNSQQNNKLIDVKHIIQLLLNKEITIEGVVSDLRVLLTNKSSEERCKGLLILSQILQQLSNDFLSEAELRHLAIFYCDRLKDHYSVIPHVFTGLLAFSKCLKYSSDISKLIFDSLVKEVTVQQFSVSERFTVFHLLYVLFDRHFYELKKQNAELIYGFIQLIEGERDPRCLFTIFKLTHFILDNIEIGPYCEDLFEVISCYFPIVFKPPPLDEYGITKEDLSSRLHHCFQLCPDFAEYLFPLLLEKLESDLDASKIDSYKVIEICCPNYGFERIKNHSVALWTAIRIDSLKPNNLKNNLTESALNALSAINQTLSVNSSFHDEFIENIWKDLLPAFLKPELDIMTSALNIIIASVSSNVSTFNKFISKLMPVLLQQFTFTQNESHRIQIIESITQILSLSTSLPTNNAIKNIDSLFMLTTSLIGDESQSDALRMKVILCLRQLMLSFTEKTEEQLKLIIDTLKLLLSNCLNSFDILHKSFILLESFALLNPNMAYNSIIKPLINNLEITYPSDNIYNQMNICLTAIEYVCSEFSIFEKVNTHLIEQIQRNCFVDEEIKEIQNVYFKNLIHCLSQCIDKHKNDEKKIHFIYNECLDPIIQHCIHLSICTDRKGNACINWKTMNSLYILIGKGISYLDSDISKTLFKKFMLFIIDGKVGEVLPVVPPLCNCSFVSGPDFLIHLNGVQALNIFSLIHSILCNINYSFDDVNTTLILDKLIYFSLNNNYQNLSICRLSSQMIGALVNKFYYNAELNIKFKQFLHNIEEIMDDKKETEERKISAINLCIWIAKGLILNGNDVSKDFISFLIKSIEEDNESIKQLVSSAFATIHTSEPLLLSRENNAHLKILYHQSFYLETYDVLLDKYTNANSNNNEKQYYLTALLSQLTYIPKAVFRSELQNLLPMLLDAINEDTTFDNQIAALDALILIMDDKNISILIPSLKSTVYNCINLSVKSAHLKVRRLSLNCLAHIADLFEEDILSPLREHVVRSIRPTLNDKKRIVRQKAVEARCKWITVGQPGR